MVLVALSDIAFLLGVLAVSVAVVGVAAYWVLGLGSRRRCEKCGSALAQDAVSCEVCGAPVRPVEAHPGADPYGYGPPDTKDRQRRGHYDAKAGYLNGRMTRRMVYAATVALAFGLSVRVVGMLEGLGVHVAVSNAVLGGLTILGGLIAFVSFVVLDAA